MTHLRRLWSSPSAFLTALALVAGALSGCSLYLGGDNVSKSEASLNSSGSFMIARQIPAPSSGAVTSARAFAPGFLASRSGTWLKLDRGAKTISVMNGETVVQSVQGEGLDRLTDGQYSILHKQRNPLWYAPESYFSRRGLTSPAEGDRTRFRRGALGSFAIFLAKDLPIHCGPMWSDEIGGVRLAVDDISRLYYALELGAPVEVH